MGHQIRDALLQSAEGKKMLIESKTSSVEIGQRIRQLKELVHSTFVSDVPEGHAKRFDVYQKAKPRIKELGVKGGTDYGQAVLKVKYAWTSRFAYKEAIEAVAD